MDKYDNLGIIGEGSYGVVIKCRHKQSGQVGPYLLGDRFKVIIYGQQLVNQVPPPSLSQPQKFNSSFASLPWPGLAWPLYVLCLVPGAR